MTLEQFRNKVLGKEITIQSVNSIGSLGIAFKVLVDDVFLQYSKRFRRWCINGNINLYFDLVEPCTYLDCEDHLLFYRDGEVVFNVILPNGESW